MAAVALRGLTKRYTKDAKDAAAVEGVDLEITDREFMVLVGPSGCGKSTLLRLIAGLEDPDAGEVWIGGRRVNDVAPKDRNIAMVFQDYALYPHMTAFENMAFSLKLRKTPRDDIRRRVEEVARMLELDALLGRKPKDLSGGERQRVALGRAIVRQPEVFLFDEPLSNLDARLRGEMRTQLVKLHRRLQSTMIYVTHDQLEAMTMGSRIAVLRAGKLQQTADPLTLYHHPDNRFVAGFLGSPPMNQIEGTLEAGDPPRFRRGEIALPLPGAERAWRARPGEKVVLGIRPEDLEANGGPAAGPGEEARPTFAARVEIVELLGAESIVTVQAGDVTLAVRLRGAAPPRPGDSLHLAMNPARIQLFSAASGESLAAAR